MKFAQMLLLTLMICGCSTNEEAFRIFGFATEETDVFSSASAEWCDRSGGEWCPRSDSGADNLIVIQEDSDECGIAPVGKVHAGCEIHYSSTYDRPSHTKVIILDRRTRPDWLLELRQLLLHELGHAGGCARKPDPHLSAGNVMAAEAKDQPEHLTTADVVCMVE